MKEFHRVSKLPDYVFSKIMNKKLQYFNDGKNVIDFSMGSPDLAPAPGIINELIEYSKKDDVHGYYPSHGVQRLRKSLCNYYSDRFGVDLSAEEDVIVTLGSKEGIASLAKAISSPGDVVFVPNPSYPIHSYSFIIADSSVKHIDHEGNRFSLLQQLKEEIELSNPKPTAVIVSYPNNPTTEPATLDFYEELVAICQSYNVYIISDLAYCELYYDGTPPPSILEAKGAKDIAIEFTSVSKSFSMAGWRVGFACGNKRLVKALKKVKSYLDYGNFYPIQMASAYALDNYKSILPQIRETYKERIDFFTKTLSNIGWHVTKPKHTMFIWAKIPDSHLNIGSMEFANLLLDKAYVAVTPGIGFGSCSNGYVRIAMIQNLDKCQQAVDSIGNNISFL